MKTSILSPKTFLSRPENYSMAQALVGGRNLYAIYVRDYVRPQPGDSVLDIGCGPADILSFLPDIDYLGFDMEERYIEAAKKRYVGRGRFVRAKVNREFVGSGQLFDIVLANGVLHHLDDGEAGELFLLARQALKTTGRLITFDGCLMPNQSKITRYILAKDRGRFVRAKEDYLRLASGVFDDVKVAIHHDLLRIPYTHIIMECK